MRIGAALDEVRARCDVASASRSIRSSSSTATRALDDRELVGLVASAVAFGNVKALRAKLEDALARLGPDVAPSPTTRPRSSRGSAAGSTASIATRIWRACSSARAACSARRGRSARGSHGDLARGGGNLKAALAAFVAAIREARLGGARGGARRGSHGERGARGSAHILADPQRLERLQATAALPALDGSRRPTASISASGRFQRARS